MIRAQIWRPAPGCWAFALTEHVGEDQVPFIVGDTDTWDEARDAAVGELKLFAGREKQQAALRGPITPGDATVPRGNRRWRWLR